MEVKLFNTLTRSKEIFNPIKPPNVGLYTCGPTVYDYLHVGNYRTYIFEDILRRTLQYLGYSVRHVMNITDVGHLTSQADEGEDKVEAEAARQGKTAWDIAAFYTKTFIEDSKELHLLPPDVLCKATDNIKEQIDLVRRLETKGLTYVITDGVYFDTAKFPNYGRLMGAAHQEGLKAGARVEANPEKRNATDFALWKFSPKDQKRQMEWDCPWGRGFPGWHIECSAMAMKYLGETFDIHCGGVDHIPIHHTNEIAQAEGATGKPFVHVWMHGEFLLMNKAKMAKSAGGSIRLQDLKTQGFGPMDYRYLCLTAHYRKQLDFSWEALEGAKNALSRLRDRATVLSQEARSNGGASGFEEYRRRFQACVSDDLDMPGALAALWDALRPGALPPAAQIEMIREVDSIFAFGLLENSQDQLSPDLQALLDQREKARREKNFAAADAFRKQLAEKGILIEDTPTGARWKRK